jgi:ribonuclease BN (tRNA processing enzyme)
MNRRAFLAGTAALASAAWLPRQSAGQSAKTRLILLGTGGGPRVRFPGRAQSANVLIIDGAAYVIDCGLGVAQQFVKAGLSLTTLRYVFITHHHSDHNLDYGNLIYSAWAAGLRSPVNAYGPPPLGAMTKAYWELNKFDIETRIADEGRPDLRQLVAAHEFDQGGRVVQNSDVRVTAARVIHPPVAQSYGYRFDATDRSIVISGDTAPSDELIKLAQGADVLVHDALYEAGVDRLVARVPNAPALKRSIMSHHTPAEDAGRVAQSAGVKMLVLSHLVPADDPAITDQMWIDAARVHFRGPVVVGKDLLEI